MRDERGKGIESRCRGRSVEENLKIWEEMKAGSEVGLANAMRFKMDMSVSVSTSRGNVGCGAPDKASLGAEQRFGTTALCREWMLFLLPPDPSA